jgi:hypothetical protein
MVGKGALLTVIADLGTLAARIPWWGKIGAKLILACLPVDDRLWKQLNLFRHGAMEEPAYAYGVCKKHFERLRFSKPHESFVGLELGPGDSLLSAMVAHSFGASAYYLIDSGAFARADLKPYRAMGNLLKELGLPAPKIDAANSLESVLAVCCATYGPSGLDSLRTIPDDSVDFVWSHAVLEHLRRRDFLEIMHQLRRVMKIDGVCSHVVDLRDHLNNSLNNLRFPECIWESRLVAQSGFYTNRIRYSEMLALFREAGFAVDVIAAQHWDQLPTPKPKLWHRFRHLPLDELRVSGFEAVLRPV